MYFSSRDGFDYTSLKTEIEVSTGGDDSACLPPPDLFLRERGEILAKMARAHAPRKGRA